MKKLLLLSFFGIAVAVNAQQLRFEDFNALPIGNVGTDITGTAPTNDIFTQASNGAVPTTSNNAGNDNFQIVAGDGFHVQTLQITGVNGDKGSRQIWMGDLTTDWEFRDGGNDIFEVEFDLYTGTAGTSRNQMGLYIFDSTRNKYLGGYVFATNTLVLSGLAYYQNLTSTPPAPLGNYLFYLGTGNTNITLAANTWVRLGVSFNKTTGAVKWKGPGINGQVVGAAMGVDPDRASFVSTSGSVPAAPPAPAIPNTAAATVLFDNLRITARATDGLLAVADVDTAEVFAVYPNPATTVVNVQNKNNADITAIAIVDLNGRVVKQVSFDKLSSVQVNIADLSAGVYMMNISSSEG
ncbi:MAG TPA: T9SS type A sorting domain-containing protein, partial [Flavobacterium sp.]|nr:T9SS type A sorting domain-containing protein [Flavobacterium sp.]